MTADTTYFKDSFAGIISKVIGIGSGFGSLWLLTNILSESGYGGYVTTFAIISILALTAQFGLRQAAIQRVAELSVDNKTKIPSYAGAVATWVTIIAVIITGSVWIFIPYFEQFIGDELVSWIRLLALTIPGIALRSIVGGVLRGLEEVSRALVLEQIVPQISRLVGLGFAYEFWPTPVAIVVVIGVSFYLPVGIFGLRRQSWKYLNLTGIPLSHIKFSGPLFVNSLASQLLKRTDILLLASLTTLSGTGGYNVAWQLAAVSQYGDRILTNVLQPRLSKYLASDNADELLIEFGTIRDLSIVGAAPVLIIMIFFGKSFLQLFGPYTSQYTILLFLTLGGIVNATFGSIGQILLMGKRGQLVLANTFVSLGGNIVLNIILIPRYGTLGAAVATLVSVYFLTNLIAAIQVKYVMGINTFDWVTVSGVCITFTSLILYLLSFIGPLVTIVPIAGIAVALLYRRRDFMIDIIHDSPIGTKL